MLEMQVVQPKVEMEVDPAKVVYTGDSKPYEGVYDVTPKTYEPVVLPTRNRLLSRDVNVKKIPYYETSNQTGVTVYIASEV